MSKISLRSIFAEYKSPHELAALEMLEDALPPELLDKDADWIVCFFAEPPSKESPYN